MVCPPDAELPRTNEKLAFLASSALCCVSLRRYRFAFGYQVRPNTCSNTSHALSGSHRCGIVESIYVKIPLDDESASFVLPES